MRRGRLRRVASTNLFVVPALIVAGMALGLLVTRAGGEREELLDGGVSAVQAAPPLHADAKREMVSAPTTAAPVSEHAAGAAPAIATAAPAPRADPNSEPHDSATGPAEMPTYDPSSVVLSEEHEMPAEVSGATDVDARAAALRRAEGSDSIGLLEQTLQADQAPRNRLLAVNSLRQMGKQGESPERVRSALRAAMADADENVAASARDAYEELAR